MLAAPNAMGHMGNDEFVLVLTRYMGQSNYITRSRWRGFTLARRVNRSMHTQQTCAARPKLWRLEEHLSLDVFFSGADRAS